jgi:hypothetical protein
MGGVSSQVSLVVDITAWIMPDAGAVEIDVIGTLTDIYGAPAPYDPYMDLSPVDAPARGPVVGGSAGGPGYNYVPTPTGSPSAQRRVNAIAGHGGSEGFESGGVSVYYFNRTSIGGTTPTLQMRFCKGAGSRVSLFFNVVGHLGVANTSMRGQFTIQAIRCYPSSTCSGVPLPIP